MYGLFLTMVSTSAFADLTTIMYPSMSDHEENPELPSKGFRMPVAPVTCTIDIENYRIVTSIPYAITTYELWDEEGNSQIVSYAYDYDFIQHITDTSGEFQLRLVTDEHTYIGYLEL